MIPAQEPHEALSEASQLGILQGRFEALQLGASQVEPHHLLLGLLKTMEPERLARAGLDPAACRQLIVDLGSTAAPAPLSPDDIDYADACFQQVALAIQRAEGELVEPHDLLRVLRMADPSR
jgi:hypothetical protein